ncbi:MAG: DUF4198 domain-containing protein [Deltaproteobacteria bacterium]|nr:DUF4198 domain-containing protein [Deltaproteobacteria bacterium]
MKNIKKIFQIILILGFCLGFSAIASAHTMWLNVTDYSPKIFSHPKYAPIPRAKTVVYFGWGHKYPVGDFLADKYLGDFFIIRPDGSKEKLTPGEGGFRATEIKISEEGGRMVAASIKPGFYGKLEGKKEFYKFRYAQYAKALINVGKVSGNPFSVPVGHKLEIIPLKNPNELNLGDWFEFKVLFDGKPAKRVKIHVCSLFSCTGETFTVSTNNEGKARIRLLHHYGPWIIKAQTNLPSPAELKDKCKELHYTATLTFEIL